MMRPDLFNAFVLACLCLFDALMCEKDDRCNDFKQHFCTGPV